MINQKSTPFFPPCSLDCYSANVKRGCSTKNGSLKVTFILEQFFNFPKKDKSKMKEAQKFPFQIPRPISSKIRYKTKIQVFSPQSYIFSSSNQFLALRLQCILPTICSVHPKSFKTSKALCTQLGFTGCTYCIFSLSLHQANSNGFVLIFLPDSTHAWQNPFIHKLKKGKTGEPFHLTNRKHQFCNSYFPLHSWWKKLPVVYLVMQRNFKINTMTKICVPQNYRYEAWVHGWFYPIVFLYFSYFQEQIHELVSTFPPVTLITALTVKYFVNMFQMFPLIPANWNTNT